jgi:hypothetical protein
MRIFACSDFHGCRPAMDKLPLAASMADLILLCGDICGKKMGQPTENLPEFQKDNLLYICSVLDSIGKPYRYIFGNDDFIELTTPNRLITSECIEGITFLPMDRVLPTGKNTNRETDEKHIAQILNSFTIGEKNIVLSHTPPYGVCDLAKSGKHCGSTQALRWINEHQPQAWFCGHIHEDFSCGEVGGTMVFNCAVWLWDASLRGWIYDTDTGKYEAIKI